MEKNKRTPLGWAIFCTYWCACSYNITKYVPFVNFKCAKKKGAKQFSKMVILRQYRKKYDTV